MSMTATYPDIAGSKGRAETSARAARDIEDSGRAEILRTRVLALYRAGNELTADEAASRLNEDVLAIRPRVSELAMQGLLMDTGKRRKNSSGKRAKVMEAVTEEASEIDVSAALDAFTDDAPSVEQAPIAVAPVAEAATAELVKAGSQAERATGSFIRANTRIDEAEAAEYRRFIEDKMVFDHDHGFEVDPAEVNPALKDFTKVIVQWALKGGRRAIFARFGLHKSVTQLEIMRLLGKHRPGKPRLIVAPLGVRQEFMRDNARFFTGEYAQDLRFVRTTAEIDDERPLWITNYESVREGKLDPRGFNVSLDEAAILRGFGGTKTFREFMRIFEGSDTYRFVATATPSPNEHIELLAYSAFLDVADIGQMKTRFFKRNSEKADQLTLHPHKEKEFWLWVASWAMFVQKPSDLGFSDEGYALPPLDVRWHEIPTDHGEAGHEKSGQARMFCNAALGVQEASKEKRASLPARIAKMQEIRAAEPNEHRVIWHDLEAEREAIEKAVPGVVSVYGSQDLDEREKAVIGFSDGSIAELAAKPVMLGAGTNLQHHCARELFLGVGFKFADFIQACHRVYRFGQPREVRIDIIYTEAEREIRRLLERRWKQYDEQVARMVEIIREYGLSNVTKAAELRRTIGVERVEASGRDWRIAHNDCVLETISMPDDSVDLVVTSIPFSSQYEYTPSLNDMGHTDDNPHFFRQMDFLTRHLFRVIKPGRVAAVHVKDRVTPSGLTGIGFQTVEPFSDQTVAHFRSHGFGFISRITVATDVVRENNQTYRLGWTEQCKDGSRHGRGMPEYVLLFRKPPTDTSNGYADTPVVKDKKEWVPTKGVASDGEATDRNAPGVWMNPDGYSLGRWQVDAHGYWRSSGDRLLSAEDLRGMPADQIFKVFRAYGLENVYDYENHVRIAEGLTEQGKLPPTFMLLQPPSVHPEVWTDITRMLTLNGSQHAKGRELHLCLARGSLILTRMGFKPIESVEVGDEVLTHKGRWRPVIVKQNTGVRPVVELKAQGVPGLQLTPDHKVWLRKVKGDKWSVAHSRKAAKKVGPDWVRADEAVGSYVNLKLPPSEQPTVTSHRYWWTIGRWLADGHHSEAAGSWVISCGKHKIDALLDGLGEYSGNKIHDPGTAYQIILRDPDGSLRTTLRQCGKGASGKHLPPEALVLPPEYAKSLLDGYLSGDGHYLADRGRWLADSVSKELLLGVAILAQRAYGAIASIYPGRPPGTAVIEGRTVNTKQVWVLCFDVPSGDRQKGEPFICDDGAWKKVRAADAVGEVDTWNLRVAEDESYTAEGCVVKNCAFQLDIVDRLIRGFTMPGEVVYDPFNGIGSVVVRALKFGRKGIGCELNPGYFADACWYAKEAEREASTPTLFDLMGQPDTPPPSGESELSTIIEAAAVD